MMPALVLLAMLASGGEPPADAPVAGTPVAGTPVAGTPVADAPTAAETPPAEAAPATTPLPAPRGPFVGDHWRYKQREPFGPWLRDFGLRILADIVAVPGSVARWEAGDAITFGLGVAIPVGMSIPVDGRSADSRLQLFIHSVRGAPNCSYAQPDSYYCPAPPTPPRFWTLVSDDIIMATTMGVPLLMLGITAFIDGAEPFTEASALALEALAVIQVYHTGLKLLTGREGPLNRDARGEYFGPTRLSFPDGTPSGHSATLFAILGTYALYFDNPWVSALLLGFAGVGATFLVIDDSHFSSEVIVGSLMGYLTARWVVEHRSSRYRYGANGLPVRLAGVAPLAMQGSGPGMAVSFTF